MWFWFIGSGARIRTVEVTYGAFHPKGCWQTSCSHSLQQKINTFGPSAMSRLQRDVPASDHVFCVPFVSPLNEFSHFLFLCSVSCSVWMLRKNVGHLSGRCIAGRSYVWVLSLGHKTSGKEAIRVVVFILQNRGEWLPGLWTWKIRVMVKRGVGEGGRVAR